MDKRSKAMLTNAFGAAAAFVAAKSVKGGKKNSAVTVSAVQSGQQRVSRNAACPCGSGKKMKKCCGAAAKTEIVDKMAETFLAAKKGIPQTVAAMLRAGIDGAEAYAYFHTADYICDDNRPSKSAEACAIWDAHVRAFMDVSPEMQQCILDDISAVQEST